MSGTPHAEREHATWSASATSRNWTCAGALAMASLAGPEKESEHAARGTAAHTIAERCLRSADKNCADYLDDIVKTKEHEIAIDEEIANSAQVYVDYVRERSVGATLIVEERFSLQALDPPFDAGGTADAVIVRGAQVEIVDFKNGVGTVEANDNKQLRTYALGAFLSSARTLAGVETIKSTIVQPRAYHKSGVIRSETIHIADLVEWTAELMRAMRRAKRALDAFGEIKRNRVKLDEWAEAHLATGACSFCPAEGFCPKKRQEALALVHDNAVSWFESPPDADAPAPPVNAPDLLSPEALGHTLDGLDALESWIKAVRSYAHAQAERGVSIPGWRLAERIGNRAWAADESKVVSDLKAKFGLTADQCYTRKIASPAQVEKIIGSKRKAEIANMWLSPAKGTNLVRADKTTRPPAKSKAEAHFEAPE